MLSNEGIKDIVESQEKKENLINEKILDKLEKLEKDKLTNNLPQIVNIGTSQLDDLKDKLIVKYKNDNFSIYDYKNILIGSFNCQHIIKYISLKMSDNFLTHVDMSLAYDIIYKFISDITIDKSTGKINITIRPYTESPLTGSIEFLINLNNCLYNYDKDILENELVKLESLKLRKQIRLIIKHFIYTLLTHTLKVISSISDEIKDDHSKKELKNQLLKYSSTISYRISIFVKNYLDLHIHDLSELNENLLKLQNVRSIMTDKLNKLSKNFYEQYSQLGGDVTTPQSYSNSNKISSSISSTNKHTSSVNSSFKDSDNKFEHFSDSNSENYDSTSNFSTYDSISSTGSDYVSTDKSQLSEIHLNSS